MANNRAISVILSLRDRLTQPMQRAQRATENMTRAQRQQAREVSIAQRRVRKAVEQTASSINKTGDAIIKKGLAIGGALAGIGTKVGFEEAMNLEGYRAQLVTAMKDTQKAGEMMEWAMNMANKTPFEGGELISAAASMESMGLNAKKYLTMAGNMAGATGRSFEEASEAIIAYAASGEAEQLKKFGITKKMIEKEVGGLDALMEKKFAGGMDTLAKTLKGKWSTVSGIFKNGLATIVGMQADGTVKVGSLYDKIGQAIGKLATKFEELQSSGKFQEWGAKLSSLFDKIVNGATELFNLMKTHKDKILMFGKMAVGLFLVAKGFLAIQKGISIISGIGKAIKIVSTATGGWGLLIIALIAGFVLLYTKSEKFRTFINNFITTLKPMIMNLWMMLKQMFTAIVTKLGELIVKMQPLIQFLIGVLTPVFTNMVTYIVAIMIILVETLGGIIEAIIRVIGGICDFITGVFTGNWEQAWNGIKDIFGGIFDAIFVIFTGVMDAIKAVIETVVNIVKGIWDFFTGDEEITIDAKVEYDESGKPKTDDVKVGKNALGTRSWRGGLTKVGEHGEELVDLPKGSKVYTNHETQNMAQGSQPMQITVKIDTFIGKEEFANECGEIICNQIKLATGNI